MIDFFNKLERSSFDEPYSNALKGYDYRTFNVEKNFGLLSDITDDKLKKFLLQNKFVHMIPLYDVTKKILIGMVAKSVVGKYFYVMHLDERYPLVFGMDQLNDYQFNEPILLCEGVKDVMVLRKCYKYSLSYLTSRPSQLLFSYLKKITNRIIFFPDNDKVGRKLIWDKKLKEEFKHYSKYYTPYGKDLGEYFDRGDVRILDWINVVLMKEGIKANGNV